LAAFRRQLWERRRLFQLRPAAGEREQLIGGGWAPFLQCCLGSLRFLRCRRQEARRRLRWLALDLKFRVGAVLRLAGRNGVTPIPEQLVLRLAGPSRVPALTTIDDAVRPVAAVAGDVLRLARDDVAAARGRIQRPQNHYCDESPGRLAPLHVVQ